MSDEVEVLNGLRADVQGMSEKLDTLEGTARQLRKTTARRTVAFAVACALFTAVLVGVVLNARYSAHQAACIRTYVNDNAARSAAILPAFQAKNDAQDDFATALASKDQAAITTTFQAYIKAVRDYQNVQAAHPLPTAPRYTC